jgi:hypothetical protein
MNDNAKTWVEALRSGEYTQTHGALRKGDSFCCLGVACDLAVKAGVIPESREYARTSDVHEYDGSTGILPGAVTKWMGLQTNAGAFLDSDKGETCLSELNDWGESFEQIADTIESEPKGLFA